MKVQEILSIRNILRTGNSVQKARLLSAQIYINSEITFISLCHLGGI